MGAEHDHGEGGHAHNHTAGANARSLAIALGLTGGFLVAELVGAWLFNSLALLSDAAHMFTDSAALAIALAAIRIGQRPADKRRTYGYRRFEILAAAFNAVLLFVVAGFVLYEGVQRFFAPAEVQSLGMLAVASGGLVINLVAMRILAGGKEASLNVKGAYLEVWSDMLGSLAVITGAAIIWFTGWQWVDSLLAVGIGFMVFPRTWVLLKDCVNILLEGVPPGMRLADIHAAITTVPDVASVHDLHLWAITQSQPSLTAHVVLAEEADGETVRRAIEQRLRDEFDLHHTTLQMERESCAPSEHIH